MSINYAVLPKEVKERGRRTNRSMTVDGEEIEFSDGFFDLHTKSYENIIFGSGFGLNDARQSIDIVHDIRNKEISILKDENQVIRLVKK